MLPARITALLTHRFAATEQQLETIDQEIWEYYGTVKTVLISDMSGFSKITRQFGILHFLSLIVKRYELVNPIVEAYQGKVIKAEADNLFLTFDNCVNAVQASIAIHQATHQFNKSQPEHCHIKVCHGIAQGKVLDLEHDYFGHAVNIASKLGEDIGNGYQTLITENIYNECMEHSELNQRPFSTHQTTVSGVDINYYKWILTD